jgi:hypothetical protein
MLESGSGDRAEDLKTLLKSINGMKNGHAKHFWTVLENAERLPYKGPIYRFMRSL